MTRKNGATRRSFIAIAGAAISAPVAAAAATLPERIEPDPMKMRLARLEDLNEIRGLNQAYFQHLAAGAHEEMTALFADPASATPDDDVRGVSPADFGEHDVIDVADDRETAIARVRVTVHTETALVPDCTLVEMARTQGEGVIRSSAFAVLEHRYIRRGDVWKIALVRRVGGA